MQLQVFIINCIFCLFKQKLKGYMPNNMNKERGIRVLLNLLTGM